MATQSLDRGTGRGLDPPVVFEGVDIFATSFLPFGIIRDPSVPYKTLQDPSEPFAPFTVSVPFKCFTAFKGCEASWTGLLGGRELGWEFGFHSVARFWPVRCVNIRGTIMTRLQAEH